MNNNGRKTLCKEEFQSCEIVQENKQLRNIIKEAKEYINNNSLYEEDYDYDYEENMYLSGIDDTIARNDLLKILDKEIVL